MLSAEKIQSNWERYLTEIELNIGKERSSILLSFLKKYKTFWLTLGNIYRFIFSFSNLYFKVNISKYGKFKLHNKFFFSNFAII